MPSGFSALDTSFPNLEGKNTEESLQTIMDYLYQLLEQLRYTLHNLGTQNFNQTELSNFVTEITEPINISIQEVEEGLSAEIEVQADRITSEITRATAEEGTLSSRITQTAEAISTEVTRASEAEGVLSSRITQNAESITAEVARATAEEGALSSRITQTADAISAEVTRATGAEGTLSSRITQTATDITSEVTRATTAEGVLSSSITQNAQAISQRVEKNGVISAINQSAEQIVIAAGKVDLSGKVSFSDLSTAGLTTINGSNITTGSIHAIDIYGSEFMDAGGNAGLDVTSSQYHQRLRFGAANQAYTNGAFGIDSYDDGNTQHTTMRFFGTDILKKSGYGTSYVEATGEWDFSGPLVLTAGYNYGTLAQRNAISYPRTGQLFFVI